MESTSEESIYKPLDFGTVLEKSLRYWIKNLRSYWVLLFLIQLTVVSVAYGAFFISGGNYLVFQIAGTLGAQIPLWLVTSYVPTFLAIGLAVVLVVVLLVNLVVNAIIGGMIVRHTADHHAQLSPTLSESYTHTKSRFWSLIGAQILVALILFGMIFGMALLIVVFSFVFIFTPFFFVALIGVLVITVLMIILIIYVSTRLVGVSPAVILGGEGAGGSISRSWHLVSGNWWRVFGVTFIIGLVTLVVGLPTGVASIMLSLTWVNPSFHIVAILAYIVIIGVIVGVTGPLGTTTTAMIYHDLMGRQFGAYEPGKPRQLHAYSKCPVCQTPVTADDKFCGNCGRQIDIE